MRTADFDFPLPPELIAQTPAPNRDQSRLLVLRRGTGSIEHRTFRDFPGLLNAGDLLVLNDSRVIPARLRGLNARTGGAFELFLLEANGVNDWWAMVRPGKRARAGTRILLRDAQGRTGDIEATVLEINEEGHRRLRFTGIGDISAVLEQMGEVPLPPYIQRSDQSRAAQDRERYQTVYAQAGGSVAAPTAGLHFTQELLDRIRACGVGICFVTLHVGLGTFAPVKTESLAAHPMHEERFLLTPQAAEQINDARAERRRVIAVGTTSLRVIESAAEQCPARLVPGSGRTRLFVHPPYTFKVADALLTNFHLPRSTLLMLACAFAAPGETRGRDLVLAAYAEAVKERYRFFSYGDAMFIV